MSTTSFKITSMRVFMVIGLLYCAAPKGVSQTPVNKKITLSLKKATFSEAMDKLSAVSNYRVYYSNVKDADGMGNINAEAKNTDFNAFMRNILDPLGLTFKILDAQVIILQKNKSKPGVPVRGKVMDAKTKEPMAGVTIKVRGTSLATVSDANGVFNIVMPSTASTLLISYIGYNTKEVRSTGTGTLSISLEVSSKNLNEVIVQARRRANNEVTLLNERKNSSIVSDGISARQIEKTASITTTQALQRVTGVTITDDKYVAIRGLGDRAVVAELNGIRLSSSNPDRSAPPLDLVPAALLDNATVYKTLTPDRPADAAAGIIELKTKSVPDSLTVSFTAQAGTNSTIGLGGNFNSFEGADLGYFGQRVTDQNLSAAFVALGNQYHGGLPQIQQLFFESRNSTFNTQEAFRINKIEDGFPPILTTTYKKAVPNQIYSASFGDSYKIFHGHTLGIIIATNYYRRTDDIYQGQRNQYSILEGIVTGSTKIFSTPHIPNNVTPDDVRLSEAIQNVENTGTETINYGVLTGLTYQFSRRNEVSVQYLASRGAEAIGRNITGTYQNTGLPNVIYHQVNQLGQSYRIFNTFNLQGEHRFLDKSWSPYLSYNGSFSRSHQDDPDFRSTEVATEEPIPARIGIDKPLSVFVIGTAHGINPNGGVTYPPSNGRYYRKLNENNYNFKADLSQPFTVLGLKQELKVGANYLKRDRDFNENVLSVPGISYGYNANVVGSYDNGLLQADGGDLNRLVNYANIGLQNTSGNDQFGAPRLGGFLYNVSKSPNNYKGYYLTRALYGMVDAKIANELRLIGGVRYESTDIHAYVDTVGVTNRQDVTSGPSAINPVVSPNTSYSVAYKPYYSINIVYNFKKSMNFRPAFNTALARPELRELTNIFEYDPFQFAVISGNPGLVNQFNRNYDFRWEWFTGPGEVFSSSLFFKQIANQLTKTFSETTQGNLSVDPEYPVIKFVNDPNQGKVYGIELEARKNLSKLWWLLNHFFIGTNLLLDRSVVVKNVQRLNAANTIDRHSPLTSPVFEQAPYAVNAYLDYDNTKSGSNVTISFNEVGERLVQVQLDGTPDLYARPVPVLDFVFSQHFWKRFIVKGFAKNLLNPYYKTVYTIPGNGGNYRGNTYLNREYKRGTEFSLGLTYNLF